MVEPTPPQSVEDMNLELVSQLEDLTARSRAYDAICAHLSRERIPLTNPLEKHADF